ncbi:GSCFA family protein [Flaviramulus basaltis]|uniref:GSCFA family protein n=2 Tax=Flaviramulus basaltis TaxID=369401 RepID=A0A1K2ILD3_9FLAO|nr:GSCFA family protein [Flaviramulus basaltis]
MLQKMNFRTQIPLEKQSKNQIDYNSNILLIGSCFSDNIGKKLDYFKFQNFQNPFGILFHPKAIETLITNTIDKKVYTEKDIFFHNEQWHCFDAHSKLSNDSKDDLLSELNSQIQLTHQQIKKSTHIIITLGTAWVYRFKETNVVVANCHKVPQKQFAKELLAVKEIVDSLQAIIDKINQVNSQASIIFTVSPVRHIKDGFVENMQSKSHLISAIHQVLNNKLLYFPSYEIMMDELRDYRFYAEDMIHPNQTAINYIWDKFHEAWISNTSFKIMQRIEVVQKGLMHKPFNIKSKQHQIFLTNLKEKKNQLKKEFPHLKF